MAEQLIVPKLGMAAAVATLTKWQVEEGGRVEKGDIVLDIEAEKTTFEMPAPSSGFVHILLEEGQETDVNTVVGLIAATEEEYAALKENTSASQIEPSTVEEPGPASARSDGARVAISPIARKMAIEHDIDVTKVTGSGPGGRIQKEDIEQAIQARKARAAQPAATSSDITLGKRVKSTLPYKGMRKVIGENMMKSLAVNAPNTFFGDFDLTEMVQYREKLVRQEQELGTRVTYAEMLIFAVAQALKQFPLMNSSLIDTEIKLWEDINIGMAVALGDQGERGLVVPVIKNADTKSLVEISIVAKALGQKARADQLVPDEMTGGTFTVSNFGSVGVSAYSTPIINSPESGILGIGRLTKKPIVKNDEIVIAPMLPYSLTHDHRVTDGAAAERFMSILKQLIEQPASQ